jgi:3-oxoadipate enol-lactonase
MPTCIDVGGYVIGYRLSGAGVRVVTLLHGLAASKENWDVVEPFLAKTHRVLALDMRGHGESDAPEGEWTRRDLAADVINTLDALGFARTMLVGHSAGGVVALEVALRFPEYIDGLVLAAAASECNERAKLWYEAMAMKAEVEGAASVLPHFGWKTTDAPLPDASGFAKAARCMATTHEAPLTPELESIACPTAIVVGTEDFIGVGGSVIMSRKIPNARLVIREGRSHAVHREEPETIAALVSELSQDATHAKDDRPKKS